MNLLDVLKIKANEISERLRKEIGDKGSCVLGYKLLVDGKKFIDQPAQGSTTCERVYSEVTKLLLAEGIDKSRIEIDYGTMD